MSVLFKAMLLILCALPVQVMAMDDKENDSPTATTGDDENKFSSTAVKAKRQLKIINITMPPRQTNVKTNIGKRPVGKFSSVHNELVKKQNKQAEELEKALEERRQVELDKKRRQIELDYALVLKVRENNITDVEILLKLGANPNKCFHHIEAPIHIAYNEYSLDIIRMLLSFDADPDAVDKYGSSLLHTACTCDDDELAELLLSYGANRFLVDNYGRCSMDYVEQVDPTPENLKIRQLLGNFPHYSKQ